MAGLVRGISLSGAGRVGKALWKSSVEELCGELVGLGSVGGALIERKTRPIDMKMDKLTKRPKYML